MTHDTDNISNITDIPNSSSIPRILIAGDRSSSGKTTISIGLMSVLTEMGYTVAPFKVGLDYIDPSYHSEITNNPSRNLDGYLMDEDTLCEVFSHAIDEVVGADIAIIEGVRGLFEGFDSFSDTGSTAQIAKILKCPVVLVINARSITRSAAALVGGYASFDKDVDIRGVILNNIGGTRHAKKAKEAVEHYTGIPVIGMIWRDSAMQISMRHLGLVPALEGRRKVADFDEKLSSIRRIIKEGIDIDALLQIARTAIPHRRPEPVVFKPLHHSNVQAEPVRIGVALDEAFNFYYHDNFDLLRINGAELVFFSPIHDSVLPDVDGVYIGGGYPELFGTELESNTSMKESILAASKRGMPIYGECGGLMYLTEKIITADMSKSAHITAPMGNAQYSMTGVLPGKTLMGTKRVVSYNVGQCFVDCIIGDKGSSFKGHEFHHSEIIDLPADAKYVIELTRGVGIVDGWDGLSVNNVVGCYAHLHGASYREFAPCFVEMCRRHSHQNIKTLGIK